MFRASLELAPSKKAQARAKARGGGAIKKILFFFLALRFKAPKNMHPRHLKIARKKNVFFFSCLLRACALLFLLEE